MPKIKRFLTSLPSHSFTIIWVALIVCLFLNPNPTGEGFLKLSDPKEITLHASLGGIFVAAILCDWQRKHDWHKITLNRCVSAVLISCAVTTILKLSQIWLDFFPVTGVETMEISSQIAGAFVFGLLYMVSQPQWITKSYMSAGE